jgi:hypothetical protein
MNNDSSRTLPIWHVRVQWEPRRENLERCVEACLLQFALVEGFAGAVDWHQASTKLRAKNVPRVVSGEVISEALLAGRQKEEVKPFRVMQDLGFFCWFTDSNKDSKTTLNLQIKCGNYFERGGNDCDLSIDDRGKHTIDAAGCARLLRDMLELWDAEFGVVYRGDQLYPNVMEILARYSKPVSDFHRGFPPPGQQIGRWRGGRVWAKQEMKQYFLDWKLDIPEPLSLTQRVKYYLHYGRLTE